MLRVALYRCLCRIPYAVCRTAALMFPDSSSPKVGFNNYNTAITAVDLEFKPHGGTQVISQLGSGKRARARGR